jgi:hypothetical protein
MIGGFIITGNVPKKVVIRGLGPSLASFGITDFLADPFLELRSQSGALLQQNDNWKDTQRPEIEATGLQPSKDLESAMVATLVPGNYTALLTGKGGTKGVGTVEVYDANIASDSQLANLSTRGYVQTGNDVMIAGFSLGKGSNPTDIAVRGIGPSLSSSGLSDVLADPTLELRNSNGTLLIANDDWQSDTVAAGRLRDHGLGLSDPKESGIYTTLPPGQYTAIIADTSGGSGIGLVEIYRVQ